MDPEPFINKQKMKKSLASNEPKNLGEKTKFLMAN
jgi:hypothetical protein